MRQGSVCDGGGRPQKTRPAAGEPGLGVGGDRERETHSFLLRQHLQRWHRFFLERFLAWYMDRYLPCKILLDHYYVTLVATEGRGELEDASHDGRIAGADEEDLAKDGYADRRSLFKHLSFERPRPRERA